MKASIGALGLLAAAVVLGPSCNADDEGDGDGFLDIGICDPGAGGFTLEIDNEFFPLPVGKKLVLDGEEDSALIRVEFTVLDEIMAVAGVETSPLEPGSMSTKVFVSGIGMVFDDGVELIFYE